ncbi:MAG: methyltransferase domain-containing protein [Marinilabiliaceae bacterium]
MISEVAMRFGGSARTYDSAASVQREVAVRLASMLVPHAAVGASVFEVGCGTGLLSERIASYLQPSSLVLNDLSPEMLALARRRVLATGCGNVSLLQADAESCSWPVSDVVVSASAVQWFARPLSVVIHAAESLPLGGLLCVATYGPLTFRELRGGCPSDYPSPDSWKAELAKYGFDILGFDSFSQVQSFPSRIALLRMVAATGVGARQKNQSTSSITGACRLTWQPVLFVARLNGRSSQNLNE